MLFIVLSAVFLTVLYMLEMYVHISHILSRKYFWFLKYVNLTDEFLVGGFPGRILGSSGIFPDKFLLGFFLHHLTVINGDNPIHFGYIR